MIYTLYTISVSNSVKINQPHVIKANPGNFSAIDKSSQFLITITAPCILTAYNADRKNIVPLGSEPTKYVIGVDTDMLLDFSFDF
jgi:hypothetical protein